MTYAERVLSLTKEYVEARAKAYQERGLDLRFAVERVWLQEEDSNAAIHAELVDTSTGESFEKTISLAGQSEPPAVMATVIATSYIDV